MHYVIRVRIKLEKLHFVFKISPFACCCSYLHMIGQRVDEFESWDPLVAADHPHVFRVLTVRDPDAIGRTLGQSLLLPCAVDVIEPDGPCKKKRKRCIPLERTATRTFLKHV